MRKIATALVMLMAVAGCTSTEKNVGVGALGGAAIGGIAGGTEGALIGAGVGALGGYLVRQLEDGTCQYRDKNGRIYSAACR